MSLWQEEPVCTRMVKGGILIAGEKSERGSKPGYPGAQLFDASQAIWKQMEEVARHDTGMTGDDELIGELYGLVCHRDNLATGSI